MLKISNKEGPFLLTSEREILELNRLVQEVEEKFKPKEVSPLPSYMHLRQLHPCFNLRVMVQKKIGFEWTTREHVH